MIGERGSGGADGDTLHVDGSAGRGDRHRATSDIAQRWPVIQPACPSGAGRSRSAASTCEASYNTSKAAIHMLSESIRLQLADTSVKIVELETPSVRTSLLPGQENSEFAIPLGEFVAEVIAPLESQPDAKEIQVDRVTFLRYGEARGDYDQVVETLNAS